MAEKPGEQVVRRDTRAPITREELQAVAAALEATGGSISKASELLGWDYKRIYHIREHTPEIKRRFTGDKDPEQLLITAEEGFNREAILTESEKGTIKRAIVEEQRLRQQDYEKLGFESDHVSQLMSLEKFAGLTLANSIRLAHGGQNKVLLGLLNLFDEYTARLKDKSWPWVVTKDGDKLLDEAYGLSTLVSLSSEVRAVYGQLQKNQVLMLRARELKQLTKQRGRPGFMGGSKPSVAIQINGAKEVKVKDGTETK